MSFTTSCIGHEKAPDGIKVTSREGLQRHTETVDADKLYIVLWPTTAQYGLPVERICVLYSV